MTTLKNFSGDFSPNYLMYDYLFALRMEKENQELRKVSAEKCKKLGQRLGGVTTALARANGKTK